MIYYSQLLPDEELSLLLSQYPAGLELIDFSVGMNLDHLSPLLKSWQKRLEALGSPALTLHGPFLDLNPASFDSLAAEAARERFSQAYEAAQVLHVDKVIFHTCRIPLVCYIEGWAERMADFWNTFLEKHNEIPIAIENVFDESPEPIADFASRIKSGNFSLCLDLGHANCFSKSSLLNWFDVLAPWITHLHLHDNRADYDAHLALGDGSINWKEVGKQIKTLPKLDGVTIENNSLRDFIKSREIYDNIADFSH